MPKHYKATIHWERKQQNRWKRVNFPYFFAGLLATPATIIILLILASYL